MKKIVIFLSAVLALIACNKENTAIQNNDVIDASNVVFDFTITHPDATKTVKSGWENGDKVFIFFEGVTTGYVTAVYNSSSATWTSTLNGTAALSESGKKLTAVYLPFGAGLTPNYSSAWTFSASQYTYYMVAEKVDYTISNSSDLATLTATLNMMNPTGFVHFYVADASPSTGAYTLETDAVVPTGIASIAADGTLTETSDKSSGDAMIGYAYAGGYSFSGKLATAYNDGHGNDLAGKYYFIKRKVSDNSREDYFTIAGTPLASHSAVSLPANGNAKWIAVGSNKWVDLGNSEVLFATCNYGCSAPETLGDTYSYSTANMLGVSLPDYYHLLWLTYISSGSSTEFVTWSWMKVKNQLGAIARSKTTSGFVFLPIPDSGDSFYWSSTPGEEYEAWSLHLNYFGILNLCTRYTKVTSSYVRPVKSKQ